MWWQPKRLRLENTLDDDIVNTRNARAYYGFQRPFRCGGLREHGNDAEANIVEGLASRWTVSNYGDNGLRHGCHNTGGHESKERERERETWIARRMQ